MTPTLTVQSLLRAKWTGGGANEWHRVGRLCPLCRVRRSANRSYRANARGRAEKAQARARIASCKQRHCTCKTRPFYTGKWTTTVPYADDAVLTVDLCRHDGVIDACIDTPFGDVYSKTCRTRRAALTDVLKAFRALVVRRHFQLGIIAGLLHAP